MVFLDLKGRERDMRHVSQYRVDWAPAREVSSWQGKTKAFLRPYWEQDIVLEEAVFPGMKRLRMDIVNVNKRVVVEVSPESSHSYNAFFHRGSRNRFAAACKRDLDKVRWAEVNGFAFVELTESDFPLTTAAFARQGVIL